MSDHRAYIDRLEHARQVLQQHTLGNLVALAAENAAQQPARHAVVANHSTGEVATSTANTGSGRAVFVSHAHTEGRIANSLDRSAHLRSRHIPLRDREHDR